MNNKIILAFAILLIGIFAAGNAAAAQSAIVPTVCCEKTISGLYCQNVPAAQCASGNQAPTSCESTSFCKKGVCYDSSEGTCLDNTPLAVCNSNGGLWSASSPPQCNLGCCILGDQAAFVSLVRCKKLSASLGLQTNYNRKITSETQCVLAVANQVKGACVYEFEFERTCKITTRADCTNEKGGLLSGILGKDSSAQFFSGMLCTAESLLTNCAPTSKSRCVDGKDEIYFVDSCGNTANVYDSGKTTDKNYWTYIKDKSESCNPDESNAGSANCGNCNYLRGSICRESSRGTPFCADLNCHNVNNAEKTEYAHGESWCPYTDAGGERAGSRAVGSRYFRHVCVNGEEVVEPCADFRQEECIESGIEMANEEIFSQAACRVNRWQDCTSQRTQENCENSDKRDCFWKVGILSNSSMCLPQNPPGLKFWEGEEAIGICAQASTKCTITEKLDAFGGETGDVTNGDCAKKGWQKEKIEMCVAIGDCGPRINWAGGQSEQKGYTYTKTGKVKSLKDIEQSTLTLDEIASLFKRQT